MKENKIQYPDEATNKEKPPQNNAEETKSERTLEWQVREQQIFDYITDLETTSLKRQHIADAVGLKLRQLYEYLTPEFWKKCLDARREKYSKYSVSVDVSLINKAQGGDVQAMKLFYEKFEDLEQKIKHSGKIDTTAKVILYLPDNKRDKK